MEILPSLISADLLNLKNVINKIQPYCDGFHIDVMDDHFVPNLTWGPAFVDQIIEKTSLPIHLHLMVANPEKWIERVKIRSMDTFIFHYEATIKNERILRLISAAKSMGCKVGIAINPETQMPEVFDYIDNIDHILVMSVNPGFSGQEFIPNVLDKVKDLVSQRNSMHLNFKIGMDGGINSDNISKLISNGVDQASMASAIFNQEDYVKAIKEINKYL